MASSILFADQFGALLQQLSSSDDVVLRLEAEIKDLRAEITGNLKSHNVTSDRLHGIYSDLCSEKQNLTKCNQHMKSFIDAKEIEEIRQIQADCREKKMKIERISEFDEYFQKVLQLVQFLEESKVHFEAALYWEAHQCFEKAKVLLVDIDRQSEALFPNRNSNPDLVSDFEFVSSKLSSDINIVYDKFIFELIQFFKENISFENVPAGECSTFGFKFISQMTLPQYESYMKCLLAHKEHFRSYMRNVCDQLTDLFLKCILLENKSTVFTNADNVEIFKYDPTCDRIKISNAVSQQKCLENVKNCIECVITLFTVDRSLDCSEELIQFIGENWSDQIFSCVIKNYFELMMPRDESQFEQFVEKLGEGHELESHLKSIGLVQENNSVLDSYSRNIKEHFSAKISQDFIIQTKKLLKSDLSEQTSSEEVFNDFKLNSKNRLPLMKVSRFMVDIKCLFEEMSTLMTGSSANLKLLLVETFANVCELFVDVSPFLFKASIEKNPQQNALFHNNCLLFAHLIECAMLTHRPRLDSLKEFITMVRNLATQIFLNQMQFQEKLLLSTTKSDTFINSLNSIAGEIPSTDLKISSQSHLEFRQCINNCLRHLNMLHTSFVGILPDKICDKTFNTLIASFLTSFLSSITSLNDISSLGASHLSHELDYFSKELKLFLANSETLVSKWIKMNEVNFILKSSLLEIVNRWADGKGVLANYLTADEVKHLIRALFQNNERRSNALSKIK